MYPLKANILPPELSPACLRTLQEAVQDLATCFPLVPLSRQSLLVLTSCGVSSSLSLSPSPNSVSSSTEVFDPFGLFLHRWEDSAFSVSMWICSFAGAICFEVDFLPSVLFNIFVRIRVAAEAWFYTWTLCVLPPSPFLCQCHTGFVALALR